MVCMQKLGEHVAAFLLHIHVISLYSDMPNPNLLDSVFAASSIMCVTISLLGAAMDLNVSTERFSSVGAFIYVIRGISMGAIVFRAGLTITYKFYCVGAQTCNHMLMGHSGAPRGLRAWLEAIEYPACNGCT